MSERRQQYNIGKLDRLELFETEKFTIEGCPFKPTDDVWKVKGITQTAVFDFLSLSHNATKEIIQSVKLTLSWYLQNSSLSHTVNIYRRFKHLLVTADHQISVVDSTLLINFRGLAKHEWYLGVLAGFFKKWDQLGYDGIAESALVYLNEITIKGNLKGESVLTLDPSCGPFTDLELNAINSAVDNAIATGILTLRDYGITKIFIYLGVRAVQVAAMKVCDFNMHDARDGTFRYTLNVPRAKENGIPRKSFKVRRITEKLGKALAQQVENVKAEYSEQKRGELGSVEEQNLPIFPLWGNDAGDDMLHHLNSKSLGQIIKESLDCLSIVSERTGLPINITSSRFRKTFGTRAAEDGHGGLVIAELLDHTDTQNVGVYAKLTPKILDTIDEATAEAMGMIADAFAGRIITDEKEAERGDDMTSRIRYPQIGSVGSCGSFCACDSLAPVACYTCAFFQPWRDAPHEQLLESLLEERERLVVNTSDARIVTVSDRSIAAVAEVVQRCAELKGHHG